MTRHHAHAGNHLVMALGTVVVIVCGVASWLIALFGGVA